jgi:hypothetical protein
MENEIKLKIMATSIAVVTTILMMILTRIDAYGEAKNNWLFMLFLVIVMGVLGFAQTIVFFRGEV